MKLSIITINKDNLVGLKKTMASVLSQSYKDFEYIVVDGASTDGSVAFVESNRQNLSYWVSEPDSGVYSAMNKGILQAKGDYLLFLNSGDFLVDENVLESVFKVNRMADILYGRCDVSENGKVVWTSNPPEKITFGVLYQGGGLAHQASFIKRGLFSTIGLYREDFKYNSDMDFWYKSIINFHVSTQKLDFVLSDYNLNGISTKECDSKLYKKEMSEILINYGSFIPDYDAFEKEKRTCPYIIGLNVILSLIKY